MPAAPPFKPHPIPATPSVGCARGTCLGPSQQSTVQVCPAGADVQHQGEVRTMAPRPPYPCPLHYPGVRAHRPRPPSNAQDPHFLPLHPPFWQLPESPHLAQVSTSSCPPLPCGSQGLSWQGQLQPQQLGLGRGAVGTVGGGAPCTHRNTPSPLQLFPWGGGEDGLCHSALGFLGAWLTPHFPSLPSPQPPPAWTEARA